MWVGGMLRYAVAALLLVAAGLEVHQLATAPSVTTGILTARWFRIAWVEFELFMGVWLLSGVYSRLSWLGAFSCFVVFSGVTLTKGLAGQDNCGCFGAVEVNPWYTFVLDVSVVGAMAAAWRGANPPGPRAIRRRAVIAALTAVLTLGVTAGLAIGNFRPGTVTAEGELVGESGIVLLEPETWVGGRFPLLGHIDVGEKLSRGRWIVVLFARGCPGCAEALPRYQKLAQGGAFGGVPVALVEIPRAHSSGAPELTRGPGPVWGLLDGRRDWFVTTPVVVLLTEGQVTAAWEGRAPSGEELTRRFR